MAFNGRIAAFNRVLRVTKNPEFEIFSFLRETRPTELAKTLQDLGRQIPERLLYGVAFPKDYVELFNWDRLFQGNLSKELQLLAYELTRYADQIAVFVKIEAAFSRAILARRYEAAEKLLSDVQRLFGVSLWLIESRLSLLELWKGVDENKSYSKKILENSDVNQWVQTFVYLFSLKAEKNTTTDRFRSTLATQFPIVRGEKFSFVHYVNFHVNFYSTWWRVDINTIIGFERGSSIIDRYLTFIRSCQVVVAKGKSDEMDAFKEPLSKVVGKVKDPRLSNLYLALFGRVYSGDTENSVTKFIEIIDAYTEGQYAQVSHAKLNEIEDAEAVGALDVIMRASARSKEYTTANDNFGLVVEQCRIILLKQGGDGTELEALAKTVQMFSKADWAATLSCSLLREVSRHDVPTSGAQVLADLSGSSSNPKLFAYYLKKQSDLPKSVSESVTYNYLRRINGKNDAIEFSEILNRVPTSRRLKYGATKDIREGDKIGARKKYEELLTIGDELDKQEAAKALVELLIDIKDFGAATKLTADILIVHPSWHTRIPLAMLLEAIETGQRELRKALNSEIYFSVCLGLYSSLYGSDRDEAKTISAEEFLAKNGVSRPSELRGRIDPLSLDALIYFLMSVCKIETLDSHIAYESERDVQDERIRILLWLSELDDRNNSVYRAEIASIAQRQLLLQGVQAVDKSRIYVDVEGVKTSVAKDLADLYSRFQNLPDTGGSNVSELVLKLAESLSSKSGLVQFVVPKNERLAALRDFILAVRDRFVSSNEYGLDVYLSVGIRHGTLSGQLRSVFESEKLVTELTASGTYAENQYWRDGDDEAAGKSRLNLILSDFSLFVDTSIAKLRNSWIQVKTEEKRGDGFFDFTINQEDVYLIHRKLTSDVSLMEASDVVIDELWRKTEKSLANIRQVLGGPFLASFTQKIDSSLAEVTAALGVDRSLPICNAFVSARTKLQNTIDDISSWFTRESEVSVPSFRLEYAVDVALEMVKRCYPTRNLQLTRSISEIELPGSVLSGMVSVMFFAFDNIMRHCGSSWNNPEARIRCEVAEEELRISISNNLYDVDSVDLPKEKLALLLNEIQQAAMPDKVRREGGTGLLKMAKTIRIDLHSQLEMDFGFSGIQTFDLQLRVKGGRIVQ